MRRARLIAPIAGLAALLAGCGDERQDVFTPEGDYAEKINTLQVPVFIVAGVVGLFVAGAMAYVIRTGIKRRDDEDAADPVQLEGNFKMEIAWTIAPALLLAVISVFTVATLLDLDDAPAGAAGLDQMEITVYGQQWWWSYEYDLDGDDEPEIITANDLVIPAGVPVTLSLESRDVIHSFWIPSLGGTKDAVPGRTHSMIIQADQPDVFDGQCKEFCGLSHANMKQRVVALEMNEFLAWTEQQQTDQPMLEPGDANYDGQQVFIAQCSSCHQIDGLLNAEGNPIFVEGGALTVSHTAPNLTHLMTRGVFAGALFDLWVTDADGDPIPNRQVLEAWIRHPAELKAMYDVVPEGELPRGMPDRGLSEEDIDKVVYYLLTLKPEGTDGPPIQTAGEPAPPVEGD